MRAGYALAQDGFIRCRYRSGINFLRWQPRWGEFNRMWKSCAHLSLTTEPVTRRQTATYPCGAKLGYHKYSKNIALSSRLPQKFTNNRFIQAACFHTTSRRFEDAKSVADKTVQILSGSKKLEEEKKRLADEALKLEEVTQASSSDESSSKSANTDHTVRVDGTDATTQPAPKPAPLYVRAYRWTVKEVKHYYHGFRLLFIEVKICSRYVWGVLNGKTLSRRERKQLVRTTADLFRLVPFTVFIIVPFMEFLLPVALKLFPGLLPSTFAEADKEKEKIKKKLKAKLEIAKFLQDTVEESALVKSGSGKHSELAREFKEFLTEIREGGTTVKTEDILKFTQLFKDEITLDNMTRGHLIALAKLLEVNTIGTNRMIVFQINLKLRQLKADDRIIYAEGLGKLSELELQQACRARGMRAIGVPEWRLRYQLKQWLDMHLNEKIPVTLLLMSRALYLPDTLSKEEQLKTVISTLPELTTVEAELHAAEVTGEKIDPAAKIKSITAEEEAIAKEKEEEAKAQEEEKAKSAETLSTVEDLEKHTIKDKATPIEELSKADVVFAEEATATAAPVKEEVAAIHATVFDKQAVEVQEKADVDQEISLQDIEELEDVLEHIAEEKKLNIDKSSLDHLKEDVDEYLEDLTELKTLVATDAQINESKSAKRLSSAVNRMIGNMSAVTDDLHRQKQHILEEIEVKQVTMEKSEELQEDTEAMENLQASIQQRKDDVISINELVLAMKRFQKIPDDTRLQKIAEVLDEDKDGQISISLVLKVLHDIGTENVNVKGSQMTEILLLLKSEEVAQQKEKETNNSSSEEETVSRQDTDASLPSDSKPSS